MAKDETNPNQDNPNQPDNPRPEIIDLDPRIVKKGEPQADYIEIIQDIEKRKG